MRPRNTPSIADLVAADRLTRVRPDLAEARDLADHAERHLRSVEKVVDDDPAAAYQLLYDAARKAVAADMLANGYRAKADKPGAHAAVVLYAEEALSGQADAQAIENFDQMRRSRNRTEYGSVVVGRAQLDTDLGHARAIVEAVSIRLGEMNEAG